MKPYTAILIAASLILLAAAGYLTLTAHHPDAQPPDDPAHAATFICQNDGHLFTLTPKQLREIQRTQTTRPDAATSPRFAPLRVTCPKCNKPTAQRATKCPLCNKHHLPNAPCQK